GNFDSYFKSKLLPPEIKNSPLIGYKDNSAQAKMIVVGDGSIGENAVMQGRALPLGFDRNSKQEFANKTFLLNCMNYLCGDESMLAVRSREVTLRLLDSKKVSKQRMKWQIINMAMPVGLLAVFGFLVFWLRNRRYGKKVI
ncbi:MAG: Gldg family protein, partial [Bacteroidia bacterium]